MRRAAKVDLTQSEIVAALRKAGVTVQPLHAVGQGCPDLAAGRAGVTYLLECKTGAKAGLRGDKQIEWHAAWRGHVAVVRTPEEALAAVGVGVSQP